MTDYTIYSIRTFNNNSLVFYNYTKQKRINDVLSSYKSRYKRYLNKCDNFMNIFYILQADKSYIKIEEKFTTDNEDNIKSKLYDFIACNNCINKLDTDQIEKLSNKTEEPKTEITENEIQNKTEVIIKEPKTEEVIIEPKTEFIIEPKTEEVIIEPKTEEVIIEPKTEEVIIEEPKTEEVIIEELKTEEVIIEEPKTEVIDNYFNTEPTNTETKIVKYIKEDVADISNNQVELLNDELIVEPTTSGIVNEPSKIVKNLADVKSVDNVYEPSITSSSRYSRPSFEEEFEELCKPKPNHNKTIKYNYTDVVKIMNGKKTLKNIKKMFENNN